MSYSSTASPVCSSPVQWCSRSRSWRTSPSLFPLRRTPPSQPQRAVDCSESTSPTARVMSVPLRWRRYPSWGEARLSPCLKHTHIRTYTYVSRCQYPYFEGMVAFYLLSLCLVVFTLCCVPWCYVLLTVDLLQSVQAPTRHQSAHQQGTQSDV